MHALGIDIGTTSLSLVLVDEASGAVLDSRTVDHGAFVNDGCPAGRTQDPERILALARDGVDALTAKHGRPACIGLTGQMHGMLYVDARGEAVSPLYTWQDGRGELPLADGRSAAQALREAGLASAAGFGLTTHYSLLKSGQVPRDAARLTTISDYLGMKLTGRTAPVLGAEMAASWGAFDLKRRAFEADALEKLGVDPRLLPEVVPGYAVIGETPEGAPVINALGDNQASVIGSVRDVADTVLINIGTGSQVSFGAHDFIPCGGDIELRPCTGEGYLLVGSGLCGGRAYAMLERFCREIAGTDAPVYDRMQASARSFVERCGWEAAWRVRTTFSGTRSRPDERGAVAGIGAENFAPGAFIAGVIAGILEELRGEYEQMTALTGRKAVRLVGSGNGLRRNPLMREAAGRLFGMPLRIPAHREEAAYGAALAAMAETGRKKSLRDAQEMIEYE